MPKIKNQYLKVDPWKIEENGYHQSESVVSESLFSLSNEYMGIRGFFEEDHQEKSLIGTYFNGLYTYSPKQVETAYLGITDKVHFMVNSVNWVKTHIKINHNTIQFDPLKISDFKRSLDFKTGELKRSYTLHLENNLKIFIEFYRLLSMKSPEYGHQKISIKSNQPCLLNIEQNLDFNTVHWGKYHFWEEIDQGDFDSYQYIHAKLPTNQSLMALSKIESNKNLDINYTKQDLNVSQSLEYELKNNDLLIIKKQFIGIKNIFGSDAYEEVHQKAKKLIKEQPSYDDTLQSNIAYYEDYWSHNDIVISGNEEHQQGIRFCLFQLQQTYHGLDPHNNIGAKGLTGEAYSGHTFWDTETFCLPFYLLNNAEAAKNLLLYRYNTLDEARIRAKELDCKGACYPIATLNGEESCDLWQHASLQLQPSTAVAYAIRHYLTITNDITFIKDYGLEMLIEISRYLYSRGDYNPDKSYYSFYGVMGPDEFQMMVNHNTYTNYLGKKSFLFTIEMINKIKEDFPKEYQSILKGLNLKETEISQWQDAANKMLILFNPETKLYEQHDGFFDLPDIDIHSIPETDFPLYHNWTYDRIYRNNMIKQPDVLMMMYLYNNDFSQEELKVNYDFYESKCIHESSLSPSIHSILALQLDQEKEGYNFFEFATRLDLDNYNRNTLEGLHLTSIYAAWMNIVYGFGGLRTDTLPIKLSPSIPDAWDHYSFKFTYQNTHFDIQVYKDNFTVTIDQDLDSKIAIYNEPTKLKKGAQVFKLKGSK